MHHGKLQTYISLNTLKIQCPEIDNLSNAYILRMVGEYGPGKIFQKLISITTVDNITRAVCRQHALLFLVLDGIIKIQS